MAIRWAVATGNWSNTATWDGGTLPTSADDVYSNGFTVTIDQNVTVLSLNNGTGTGVPSSGGGFTCSTNRTISATGTGLVLGFATNLLTLTHTSGTTTVNANIPQSAISAVALRITGVGGTTTVNGIINATTSSNNGGINASGALTVNVNGLVNATGTGSSYCIVTSGGVTLNVTGDVSSSSTSGNGNGGISCAAGDNVTIVGSVITQWRSQAINMTSTANITITGEVRGNSGMVYTDSTASRTINVPSLAIGTLTIIGMIKSLGTAAVFHDGTSAVLRATGPFVGYLGLLPFRWTGLVRLFAASTYEFQFLSTSGQTVSLYSADQVGTYPSSSDVAANVVYGNTGQFTGTMQVPPASAVTLNVPVDATIGTASLSTTDVANLLTTTLNSALSEVP